jgi:hypothetical protein
MITKSKRAHGAMSAKYQSRLDRTHSHAALLATAACGSSKAERPGVGRREPMTNQAYLFLLLWIMLVLSAVDGLAAVLFHVG